MRSLAATEPGFHRVTDGTRLLGFVAIDSTVAGCARGGLRIASDLEEEEIRAAARAMTLKYGLLGLPQGGAKAGVFGDPEAPLAERRQRLLEFARAAAPLLLERRYVPEADFGTSAADIRWMMLAIGARVGAREWREGRSGDFTAVSVLAAAAAMLARRGASFAGTEVAIEGFGKVGAALAARLHARGARVVAVSTSRGAVYRPEGLDVPRLARRAAEVGSRFVQEEEGRLDREALLELPVDLLSPCARFRTIHAGNVGRIAARAVCAGANDPVSSEAEADLRRRGIVYPPDFVSNCGGVLGGTLAFAGVREQRIDALVERRVGGYAHALLARAERLGESPRALATSEAETRHGEVRADAERGGLSRRLLGAGLESYRRGWIPETLMGLVAPAFIGRELGWTDAGERAARGAP